MSLRTLAAPLLAISIAVVIAACDSGSESAATAPSSADAVPSRREADAKPVTLRLGYFPNITHAQPLVGLARGVFAEELGAGVTLETRTFNAGPSAIEALFAGAIDATYIGPNPAINGYVQSDGEALRIIAGATSGGAALVVRADSGIETPADFAGKKVATPQLGNTQDVALRSWLQQHGLRDREHGGNVQVTPTANADTLSLFRRGEIEAAWVPEPWATRLVQEAGGRIFLDERELWPDGDFVSAHLIVRTAFLSEHPDVVERLLRAHVKTTLWINAQPDEAKRLVNEGIARVTGAALPEGVIDAAWQGQRVTYDPVASSLRKSADDAYALGFLGERKPDLSNIYALEPLNRVLRELGLEPVRQ